MYYQKLKGLWDVFDALKAPYLCLCVCSFEIGRINGEMDQRKRLIQLLMGLDECYSNIIWKILLMQPLPTAVKAYTMIRQEEMQIQGIAPKSASSTILNSYSNRYNPPNNQNYPKHNMPNTPNSRFTPQRPTQTSFERKSSFSKGVYCGNCGKDVQPPKQFKATKAVNMVMTHDQASQDKASTLGQDIAPSEDQVSARMDQLQNQLNQVLLMLQQNGSHGTIVVLATSFPHFEKRVAA
nr:cysteine-rich RLK (receptor-like protein kinase) 8 [Tanacetum cinerariifolium]